MKHIWSVLCLNSIIDKETNNLSIFNILEKLTIESDTQKFNLNGERRIVPIQYELITLWNRGAKNLKEEKAETRTEMWGPDNKLLQETTEQVVIAKEHRATRIVRKFNGFPIIDQQGEYVFKIKIKEGSSSDFKIIAEIPVEIVINLRHTTK